MLTFEFTGVQKRYKVLYFDPPWNWQAYSPKGEGRSAKNHYPVMSLEDIKTIPVQDLADKDSVLLIWATDPLLEKAFEVIRAWGFIYKTVGFYWVKTNKRSPGYFMGNGYYTRANPEICLLATRGKGVQRQSRSVRRLVVAPVGRHSEKPEKVRARIESLFGDVSRIEGFARCRRPGWDAFGNEIESKVLLKLNQSTG